MEAVAAASVVAAVTTHRMLPRLPVLNPARPLLQLRLLAHRSPLLRPDLQLHPVLVPFLLSRRHPVRRPLAQPIALAHLRVQAGQQVLVGLVAVARPVAVAPVAAEHVAELVAVAAVPTLRSS